MKVIARHRLRGPLARTRGHQRDHGAGPMSRAVPPEPTWVTRTAGLSVRPAAPDDVDATWAYRRLPDVGEWLPRAAATRDDYAAAFMDPVRLERTLVVERDGALVGDLYLHVQAAWAQAEVADRGRAAVAEIGWVIDPAHGGRGLATEAVWSLADFCFTELGVHRVQASCFADNVASWRLMERIGMHREGHTRGNALHRTRGWLDGYHYALLEQDWQRPPQRVLTLLVDSRGSDRGPGGPRPTWIRSRGCPRRTTARAGVGPQPASSLCFARRPRPTRLRRPTTAETSTEPMVNTQRREQSWWEQHWWTVAAGTLAALVAADLVTGQQINGAYAGAAVVAGLLAGARTTTVVAVVAVVASIASGVWNHNLGEHDWALRFAVCCALSWVAVLAARLDDRRSSGWSAPSSWLAGCLNALAVELTGARTVKDVADGFTAHAMDALGATSAMVLSLDGDDVLRAVSWRGRGNASANRYQELPLSSDVPGAVAVRTGTDLHYRSVGEIEAAFPDLTGYYTSERSLHMLPLRHDGFTYGALALTFPPEAFTPVEDRLLRAVADALTSAIVRARELQASDAEGQRVSLLAEASMTLSRSLDVQATLAETGRLLVPRFADWCAVQLLQDGELETVGIRHRDPETSRWAEGMRGVFPTQMDRPTGAPNVVRTGRSEIYPFIPADLLAAAPATTSTSRSCDAWGSPAPSSRPSPDATASSAPSRSSTPSPAGATATTTSPSSRRSPPRVAFALDTATTFEAQSERLAGVTLVADAAQRAILAPPPPRLGPVHLTARYHAAAAEAKIGGDLYEVVAGPASTRLLVGDVRGKGLKAVRTATVVLGEFRAGRGRRRR